MRARAANYKLFYLNEGSGVAQGRAQEARCDVDNGDDVLVIHARGADDPQHAGDLAAHFVGDVTSDRSPMG